MRINSDDFIADRFLVNACRCVFEANRGAASAIDVVAGALKRLESASGDRSKRGVIWAQDRRRDLAVPVFQRLVYIACNDQPQIKEDRWEMQMLFRYLLFIFSSSFRCCSRWAAVGLGQLVYSYSGPQVDKLMTPVSGTCDERQRKRIKRDLMKALTMKFPCLKRAVESEGHEAVGRGGNHFVPLCNQADFAEVLLEWLELLCPWQPDCFSAAGLSPVRALQAHIGAFAGLTLDVRESLADLARCHVFTHPGCLDRLTREYCLPLPTDSMRLPLMTSGRGLGGPANSGGSTPLSGSGFGPADIAEIRRRVRVDRERRRGASARVVSILVDGASALVLRHASSGASFPLPRLAEIVEVFDGEPADRGVLIATHILEYDDDGNLRAACASVRCGLRYRIRFSIDPSGARYGSCSIRVLRPLGLLAAPFHEFELLPGFAAALCICLLALLGFSFVTAGPPAPVIHPVTFDLGTSQDPSVSGEWLAYASDRSGRGDLDIWVRNSRTGASRQITEDPSNDYSPSICGNGAIAFRSDRAGGGIYLTATNARAGEERLVVPKGFGPRCSPDGQLIAFWTNGETYFYPSELAVANVSTGAILNLHRAFPSPRFYGTRFPVWSANGKSLLFWGALNDDSASEDWWVFSLSDSGAPIGPPIQTHALQGMLQQGIDARRPYSWDGEFVYFSAGDQVSNLWKIRLSPGDWKASDGPVQMTFGSALETDPIGTSGGSELIYSRKSSSVNVYAIEASHPDLHRGYAESPTSSFTPLTQDSATDMYPSISADGLRLVYSSTKEAPARSRSIWLRQLGPSGQEDRVLVRNAGEYDSPHISPDGLQLAYTTSTAGLSILHVLDIATGHERTFQPGGPARAWSSDGSRVLFESHDCGRAGSVADHRICIGELTLSQFSGRVSTIATHPVLSLYPTAYSAKGEHILFVTRNPDGNQERQLWIAKTAEISAGPSRWTPAVSSPSGKDRDGVFSVSGDVVYFLSERDGHRCVWAQRIDKNMVPVGEPFEVVPFHRARQSIGFGSPAMVGLSVIGASDRILASVAETNSGNIMRATVSARGLWYFLHWGQ